MTGRVGKTSMPRLEGKGKKGIAAAASSRRRKNERASGQNVDAASRGEGKERDSRGSKKQAGGQS